MPVEFTKHRRTIADQPADFSVMIPSWNNLDYLKLCIRSLRQHAVLRIQIIVLVNEGKDGTMEWLETQPGIDVVHARENIGICYGMNLARSIALADYIVYMNDDMVALPGWDKALKNEIDTMPHKYFMLSATMIEPVGTGNACVVVKDYGKDIGHFREAELIADAPSLQRGDWSGSTWPPNVVHKDLWDMVGGLSIEFSPGMYSDPDFSKKLYEAGVRHFKGVGKSLVYHFGSKSTKRIRRNRGRITFLMKWGMTASTFMKKCLRIGQPYSGITTEYEPGTLDRVLNTLKRIRHSLD